MDDLPHPLRWVGLAAGDNVAVLTEQATRHQPPAVSLLDPAKAAELARRLPGIRVRSGKAGPVELATLPEADIVLIAIVGTTAPARALAAIRDG